MNRTMRVSWAGVVALVCAVLSIPANAADKVTFVMSWAPDARWAGEFLAKERGYFAREGLEVTFANQRGSLAALQQVGAGGAEFSSPGSSDVIVAPGKGVGGKAVTLLGIN